MIPIKLACDKPSNNLVARYEAYDTALNRLACMGDGESACRANFATGETVATNCAGPEACDYANQGGIVCALRVRMQVQIDGQSDPFAVFELQSGSINTYRTLAAKLRMMWATFGKRLRNVPMELAIYRKSSATSHYLPFYVVDLRLREGITPSQALAAASDAVEQDRAAGLDFVAMEQEIEAMRSEASLAFRDAEAPTVIFAPDVAVDRARLARRSSRQPIPQSGTSIQAIVQRAIEQGGAHGHPTEPAADPAGIVCVDEATDASESDVESIHNVSLSDVIETANAGPIPGAQEAPVYSL